jgi:phosphoribosylaminoimidazole (AIR) synthetase
MGVGMCIILPKDRADTVINIAKKHNVEASVIGSITEKKGVWLTEGKKETDISIREA